MLTVFRLGVLEEVVLTLGQTNMSVAQLAMSRIWKL